MTGIRVALLALALSAGAMSVSAQESAPTAPASPILTLDQERLFAETAWGKRAAVRIAEASAELAAENRRIEAELTAEERALTDKRATMPVEEFREAADDFDDKVTEIRQTQDAKARAIGQMQDAERQRFFAAAFPALSEVLRRRGAVAVLDSRAIFLAADVIDVTDELIAEIDESIGDGARASAPEEEAPAGEGAPAEGEGSGTGGDN